jgi:pyruvate-formate lyase-activating enzyme
MEENRKVFNQKKPHLTDLPDEINIETVFGCNIRCRMCIMRDLKKYGGGRKPTFMDPAVFSAIIGQISDRPRTICLNQNGEPLLHPEIVTFVREAKKHGHFVFFVTNGTRLDENLAKALIGAGLDRIIFSIDGIRKETYEAIRVGADFDTVLENTLRFISIAEQTKSRIQIEVHCILSDLTLPDKREIEMFWKNRAKLIFLPFDDWGGFFEGAEDDFGRPRTAKTVERRYPCDYLWTTLNISADGRMIYCCHDHLQRSRLPAVTEALLGDVWKGEIAREREKHVNNQIDTLPCLRCNTWMTRAKPGSPARSCASRLIQTAITAGSRIKNRFMP